MKLVPESTFDEVSRPFGILVPGGGLSTIMAVGDENLLQYVRSAAQGAKLVGSVGAGSLNLGATYVQRRWIEDSKFITSGGTSGGIDMALHLVAKHKNERSARQVQLWV